MDQHMWWMHSEFPPTAPNRPPTSAVIGLLISVQMFEAAFPGLQVYSVKLRANEL